MKKYSVIRNYKVFKKRYLYFLVFVKSGEYYYTFDSDAKIMMYIYDAFREDASFRIEKEKWPLVVSALLEQGLNVVLTGWKNAREYYATKENRYMKYRTKSKLKYREIKEKRSQMSVDY